MTRMRMSLDGDDVLEQIHGEMLTTLLLIRSICAVPLAVAQEALGYAASLVVAELVAAFARLRTVHLIRPVLTVVVAVAHLPPWDAAIPMGALELVWNKSIKNVNTKWIRLICCTGSLKTNLCSQQRILPHLIHPHNPHPRHTGDCT